MTFFFLTCDYLCNDPVPKKITFWGLGDKDFNTSFLGVKKGYNSIHNSAKEQAHAGVHKHELEPTGMGWNYVSSHHRWLWCCGNTVGEDGKPPHGATHSAGTGFEAAGGSKKVGQLLACLLPHSKEVSQQIRMFELQDGDCFVSAPKSHRRISLRLTLARNIQERELWEL